MTRKTYGSNANSIRLIVTLALICLALFASQLWAQSPIQRLELVTDQAQIGGDGGSAWGGHQTRIVSNQNGIFTAYTIPGTGTYTHTSAYDREWRLAKRTGDNQWTIIAQGPSGREPALLLSAPDGTLRLISCPNMVPEMCSITGTGSITSRINIPGTWVSNDWPYVAASINTSGDIIVWQSDGPASHYSIYTAATNQWHGYQSSFSTMKRHCYCYPFVGPNNEVTTVGTRDIPWSDLGQTWGGYAFTAVGYFHTPNAATQPAFDYKQLRAAASDAWMDWCCATASVYIDTIGRVHIIYFFEDDGVVVQGIGRHMIVKNGVVIADVPIPGNARWPNADLVQNAAGQFFIITPTALYPAKSEDGTVMGDAIPLSFTGYTVRYGGFTIACPQAGVPLQNDYVDLTFPSGPGTDTSNAPQHVYCRLALTTTQPSGSVAINGGAAYSASADVTLNLSASSPGSTVADMRFSGDNVNWSAWETYASTKAWSLPTGDGSKTVYVQYRDAAGYESTIKSDTITLDTAAPTGSAIINDGAACTQSTVASLALSATDNMSGSIQMRLSNDNATWSAWEPYTSSKTWTLPSGDGIKPIYVQFMDAASNVGSANSSIVLDNTAPSAPGVPTDAGAYTGSTSITFNWTAATDAASGVSGYTCRIGTTAGGNEIFNGSVGNALNKTITGSFGRKYYCSVQAIDAAGNIGSWSLVSDGIMAVSNPSLSIVAAKSLTNLASVGLDAKAVSAIYADRFYIQETNRSAGIMVVPSEGMPSGIGIGKLVDIGGTVKRDANGECWIDANVSVTGTSADVLPLAMTNATMGGGDWDYSASPLKGQKGVSGAKGLNNIGLLVKIWGKVTYADPSGEFAYIDDGAAIDDGNTLGASGTAVKGVRVYAADVNTPKVVDEYVVATGISSLCTVGASSARALKEKPAGGAIFGKVTTGSKMAIEELIESPHDYYNNGGDTWMVVGPSGTIRIRAHFTRISIQADDLLYVSDINYETVNLYTGNYTDFWSDWIPGDTIMLGIVSDASGTDYGFQLDKYEVERPNIDPIQGVAVLLNPGNKSTTTDAKGAFSFSGLVAGQYQITPSLSGSTLDPTSISVTLTEGQVSSGHEFVKK